MRRQMNQSILSNVQHSFSFGNMKLGRVWLPIVQSWGFYPCIASICLRFSRDGLGPCYYRVGVSLIIAPTDCTIQETIGSR